jgi:hypothetical protein
MADNEMLWIGTQEGNNHNARHILHQQKFVFIEQILTRGVKFYVKHFFFHYPKLSVYVYKKKRNLHTFLSYLSLARVEASTGIVQI